MAGVAMIALDITLWGLSERKMELLIQCVPAFLIALHWRGLRARPALAGLVVGAVLVVAGVVFDLTRVGGLHVGVIGLALNVAIGLIGSVLDRGGRAEYGQLGEMGAEPRSLHDS